MKILHVNKFFYRRGGAEGYLQDVAALQEANGHQVAYFAMQHPDNDPSEYEAWFPAHIEMQPLPPTFTGKARAAGRMLWSTSARRGIDQVVEAFRPDVAHLHNVYHQLSPSVLRPLARRRIPAVMTLHDYKLACPTYQMLDHGQVCQACFGRKYHQAVIRRCKDDSRVSSGMAAFELAVHMFTGAYDPVDIFVCPSRFLAAKMAEAGVYPDRMRHVPHFIDTAGIAVKERPGGNVVFAGRLAPEKGVDTLVDAVGRLGPEVVLDIAGDGPERPRLEAQAAEVAPGRVRFHGRLDKQPLDTLVRAAAVSVLPARWYENQPMSVLEALACGVPVVGSTLGGIPELLEPGVHGDLVPPDDPAALADALAAILSDPDRAMEMGRAARTRVEQEFSPSRHLERLAKVYAEAAAAKVA